MMISVIIPHLNQPDGLEACLCSLDAQSLDRDQFEVIVVDNGSRSASGRGGRAPSGRPLAAGGPARAGSGAQHRASALQPAKSSRSSTPIAALIRTGCSSLPGRRLRSSPPGTILGGDVRIWRPGSERLNAIEAYESVFAYRFKLYIEKHGYSGTGNLAMFRRDFDASAPSAESRSRKIWNGDSAPVPPAFGFATFPRWSCSILRAARFRSSTPNGIGKSCTTGTWRKASPHGDLRWIARALWLLASPAASASPS